MLFDLFQPLVTDRAIQYANYEDGRQRRAMYDPAFQHEALEHYFSVFVKVLHTALPWCTEGSHCSHVTFPTASITTFASLRMHSGQALQLSFTAIQCNVRPLLISSLPSLESLPSPYNSSLPSPFPPPPPYSPPPFPHLPSLESSSLSPYKHTKCGEAFAAKFRSPSSRESVR